MFSRCATFALTAAILTSLAGHARAQEAKDVTIEGQLKIGLHKFKLDAGTLYQFDVKGKNFAPSVVLIGKYIPNSADFFKDPNSFRGMIIPEKSQEYTLIVNPTIGIAVPAAVLDYTLTLKTMPLNETPLLKKEDKLVAEDPLYMQAFRKTRHKVYPLTMKAGQAYVIEMIRANPETTKLDPYLFLENPNKIIVAQDDDGAGNLNARILFHAPADGEYRIIATAYSDAKDIGDYTLTVRTVKDAK